MSLDVKECNRNMRSNFTYSFCLESIIFLSLLLSSQSFVIIVITFVDVVNISDFYLNRFQILSINNTLNISTILLDFVKESWLWVESRIIPVHANMLRMYSYHVQTIHLLRFHVLNSSMYKSILTKLKM